MLPRRLRRFWSAVGRSAVSGEIEASGTNECDWTRQHHHNVPFLGLHLALGEVKDGANVVKDGHDFLAGTGESAPRERERGTCVRGGGEHEQGAGGVAGGAKQRARGAKEATGSLCSPGHPTRMPPWGADHPIHTPDWVTIHRVASLPGGCSGCSGCSGSAKRPFTGSAPPRHLPRQTVAPQAWLAAQN